MSEQNPLQEAQELIRELNHQADQLTPDDLKSQLTKLDDLLSKAAQRGDGEDAESLRSQLNANVEKNATFNSMMVHEIRKPMTSIRGYSDMLAKPGMIGPLNEMQQQFIDTIRNNVIRMEGLVTDISDMNKLSSGRMRLDIVLRADAPRQQNDHHRAGDHGSAKTGRTCDR
jgi:signal transduction histidine kinase